MIGRFFYHAFWNFYDYLGTLTLIGILHTLLALGSAAAVAAIMQSGSLGGYLALAAVVLFQFVFTVAALSALLPFCAKAARNEPARWPDLMRGLKEGWPRVALHLGLWLVVLGLLVVNFFFYLRLNASMQAGAAQMSLIIVTATVAWLSFAWLFFGLPWLCAGTAAEDKTTLRQVLSKALMAIALLPGAWLTAFVVVVLTVGTGLYTRLGMIFVLPVFASLGHTAYALSVQYAGFLAAAREEQGEGRKLGEYKKRAREMAWEWEHRQPRRTFKELIRPWEY